MEVSTLLVTVAVCCTVIGAVLGIFIYDLVMWQEVQDGED